MSGLLLKVVTTLAAANLLLSQIALAADEAPKAPQAEASAPVDPDKIIAKEGEAINMPELEFSITPPAGWEVTKKSAGMSLVMQEPGVDIETVKPGQTIFKRNITVVTTHAPMPIDEKQAQAFKEKLEKDFAKATGATNFQILDKHKFFDYRGKNDGLVIYTQFTANDVEMAQMHVLVSGSEKSYVLTYTDTADAFTKNEAAFQKAWATMSTIQVTGVAPKRYADVQLYGALASCLLLCASLGLFYRYRRASKAYAEFDHEGEDTSAETSSVSTLTSAAWGFNTSAVSELSPLSEIAPISTFSSVKGFDQNDQMFFSDAMPLTSSVSSIR